MLRHVFELSWARLLQTHGTHKMQLWPQEFFVKDLGAAAQTYSSEYNAACRYYGSCAIYAYGTNVMSKAATIQKEIDKLERD